MLDSLQIPVTPAEPVTDLDEIRNAALDEAADVARAYTNTNHPSEVRQAAKDILGHILAKKVDEGVC